MFRRALPIIIAAALGPLVPIASAQMAAPTESITPGKILDDFIVATGGAQAYRRIATLRTSGQVFHTPGLGERRAADFEIYFKAPNKHLSEYSTDGVGVLRSGFDGERGWYSF